MIISFDKNQDVLIDWINNTLAKLETITISQIQNGEVKFDFKNANEISSTILDHLLDKQLISLPFTSSEKNIVLIVGSIFLYPETLLNEISSINYFQEGCIHLLPYSEIKSAFFDYSLLLKSEYLKSKGKDKAFDLIYKFNYMLQLYYEALKPNIIKELMRISISCVSILDDHGNANDLVATAFKNNYTVTIVELQVKQIHLSKAISNYNTRFGVDLSSDLIYANQSQRQFNFDLIHNHITVNSIDNENSTYKYVSYNLAAKTTDRTLNQGKALPADLCTALDAFIQSVNKMDAEKLNANNVFSRPYQSLETVFEQHGSLSPHAVPVFDARYFSPTVMQVASPSFPNRKNIRSLLEFKPDRLFLHLLIVKIYTTFSNAKNIANKLINDLYQSKQREIEDIVNKIDRFCKETKHGLFNEFLANDNPNLPKNADEFTNLFIFNNVSSKLSKDYDGLLSDYLSNGNYPKLDPVEASVASASFLVGGCGCGKTTYKKSLLAHNSHGFDPNVLYLNIDDLFDILYSNDNHSSEIIFSEISFEEVLMLHDRIINEIIRISHSGKLPNLYYEGIYFIDSLARVYAQSHLKITFLSVSLDVALNRVYRREAGLQNPLGTYFVVNTYRKNASSMMRFLLSESTHYSHCEFQIANTEFDYAEQKDPIKIAKVDLQSKTIDIFNFNLLCKYLFSANANAYALDSTDIYSSIHFNEVVLFLRQLFSQYNVRFIDPANDKLFLQIKAMAVLVEDKLLFDIHIDSWALSVLKSVMDKPVEPTLPARRPINFDIFSDTNHPASDHASLATLLQLIKNLQKIFTLNYFKIKDQVSETSISELIDKLFVCFEDHICNPEMIVAIIGKFLEKINHEEITRLINVEINQFMHRNAKVANLKNGITRSLSDNPSSGHGEWHHRVDTSLGRYYESEFSMHLMQTPPSRMMEVVGDISKRIVKLIELNKSKANPDIFAYFLNRLHKSHATYGKFSHFPTLEDVYNILLNNNPKDICQIILIHFIFTDVCYRNFEVFDCDYDGPSSAFASKWNPDGSKFDTKEKVYSFTNVHLYGSELFKNRHRASLKSKNPICDYEFYNENHAFSAHHGISYSYSMAFFGKSPSPWYQDKFFSFPNLGKSEMALGMHHAEVPYVSNISGMATLFIPCALLVGRMRNQTEFAYYLLAIAAYLAHGGLHSWHETFAVGQYKLNLLEAEDQSYQILGEGIGNFSYILNLLKDDSSVANIRKLTRTRLNIYYSTSYEKRFIHYGTMCPPFEILSHERFRNELTLYDLDKLHIKLCEKSIEKIISKQPKSTFSVANTDVFYFVNLLTALAATLKTPKSFEELDKMLVKFDNTFIKCNGKFSYSPSTIWKDFSSFMRDKYQELKNKEEAAHGFLSSSSENDTANSQSVLPLSVFKPIPPGATVFSEVKNEGLIC
jgi:hypothetical protein